jgi:hypothetical protein
MPVHVTPINSLGGEPVAAEESGEEPQDSTLAGLNAYCKAIGAHQRTGTLAFTRLLNLYDAAISPVG